MSREVAKLIYSRKCGSMARKAVLAYFAERANDDGTEIWASKQRIALEIECSRQTVITTVKGLEADGLIHRTGERKTQGGHTVIYRIDLEAVAALEPAKPDENQSTDLTASAPEVVKEFDWSAKVVKLFDTDQSNSLTQTVHEPSIEVAAKATTSRRRARDRHWPRPDWADPVVYADFLENRHRRRLPNTATAYAGFLADIASKADEEWPPGRLLLRATTKGWGSIHHPNEDRNGRRKNIPAGQRQGNDRRSSLARAIDDGLEWLGGP